MAISLGTSLTPYMGRGRPKVVITGKFVPGLVDGPDEETIAGTTYTFVSYYMMRLFLVGLATAASGHTFSLVVSNRTSSGGSAWGSGGDDPFDPNVAYPVSYPSGLTSLTITWSGVKYTYDNSGFVRLVSGYTDMPASIVASGVTGGIPNTFYSGTNRAASIAAAVGANNGYVSKMGTVLLPDLTIVLDGKLAQLDLTAIKAGDFLHGSTDGVADQPSDLSSYPSKMYNDPVHGLCNGWIPGEVHIFDQPQLRGHVTVPSTRAPKVVWDA